MKVKQKSSGFLKIGALKFFHYMLIIAPLAVIHLISSWKIKLFNHSQATVVVISTPVSGADPGEGHRGQMTPPSKTCQGSQKLMYWYDSNEFKLSFLYFCKIKTIAITFKNLHLPHPLHHAQGVVQWGWIGWLAT